MEIEDVHGGERRGKKIREEARRWGMVVHGVV